MEEEKKDILIIKRATDSFEKFFCEGIKKSGYDVLIGDTFLECGLRGISLRIHFWKKIRKLAKEKYFDSYSKIILFESYPLAFPMLFYVGKRKMVLWLWNTVQYKKKLILFLRRLMEVWTFDENDAKKYGFRLNTQFYFNGLDNKSNLIETNDLFFVGADKGRYPQLKTLKEFSKSAKLNFDINMFTKNKDNYPDADASMLTDQFMCYEEVLNRIQTSKAVLDLTQENQVGMTMRALEALYFDKKIITNNVELKTMEFYSPNKVFILGERDVEELPQFLEAPSIKYDNKYKEYYDVHSWILRFGDDN